MTDLNDSEDLIHVSAYTKDDGTQVDDYYRHKSGEGNSSENNDSGNINVANTVSNILTTVGDKKSFDEECPALYKLFGSVNKSEMNDAPLPDPGPVLKGGVEVFRIVLEGIAKAAKVAVEAIAIIAPVVAAVYEAYQACKGIYSKVSDFFSSKQTQTQVKTINTGIQGLRETQNLQKRNLDLLTQKAVNARSQEEYSNLYKELLKQKSQYDKNNALLDKIEYSAKQQDYESVQKGLEEYLNNANQTIEDSTSTIKGYVEKSKNPEFDDSHFNQKLPYNFEDSHTTFEQDHSSKLEGLINNVLGIQPASAEENFRNYPIASDGSPLIKSGISYDNGTFTPKTIPTKIESMEETSGLMSVGVNINDFIKALGENIGAKQETLQKIIDTFNSPTGQTIKTEYQKQLETEIAKIANECTDAIKSTKIAGEIAEKIAPYLAVTYILEQAIEGYAKNGQESAKKKLIAAIKDVGTIYIIAKVLELTSLEALPIFILSLIIEYILKYFDILE